MISAFAGNMAVHHAVVTRSRTKAQPAPVIPAISTDLAAARVEVRTTAMTGERPQTLTPQHTGPARAAARAAALGSLNHLSGSLADYHRDLASGLQAGPKPASAVAAEARYLQARRAIG